MLEKIHRLSAIFERLLPPYADHGPAGLYYRHRSELEICAYFGRAEIFDERQDGRDNRPFADILKQLKRTKPDDLDIAASLLIADKLSQRIPLSPRAQSARDEFSHVLRGLPDGAERVMNYFTEQCAMMNYGENKRRPQRGHREDFPDGTLSTCLLYTQVNPRMALVASDVSGVVFRDDGVFFEGANFRAADMRRTVWHSTTSIKGALLEGADLSGAKGLSEEILSECYIDKNTKLPGGLSRAKIAKIHNAMNLPPAPAFTALEAKYMPKPNKPQPQPNGLG